MNVKWARQQALEAEQELLTVRTHMARVEEAINGYQQQAKQLSGTMESELLKGTELLKKSVAILQAYTTGTVEGMSYADKEMSHGVATPVSIASQVATSLSSLISPENAAYNAGYGIPPHLDIRMIPIDQIDISDSWVTGSEDFRKDSDPQVLEEAFRKLQDVVIPALAKGVDSDYFAQLDATQGLQNADSYLNVYNVFYGDDAIRLEMVGEQYKVIGGFHRLYIARQLGIQSVPARVISSQL